METKSFLKSRTILGALIAAASPALPVALRLAGADKYVSAEEVTALAQQAMVLGGSALAIYGRVKATKRLA